MKFPGTAFAALIVLSTTVGDGPDRPGVPIGDPASRAPLGATVADPPFAPVQVGDRAPDFTWVGVDNQPHHLREVLDQAHALVVFAPSDDDLQKLESERNDLALMGVVPIAILDARGRTIAQRVKRTGVHFIVVPDPTRAIGAQFHVIDPHTAHLAPAWFAIDRRGLVRGFDDDLGADLSWTRLAASALAIPARDTPLPAKTR